MKKYYRDNQEVSSRQWHTMLLEDIKAVESRWNVPIAAAVHADVARDQNTVVNHHKYEWYNTNA